MLADGKRNISMTIVRIDKDRSAGSPSATSADSHARSPLAAPSFFYPADDDARAEQKP